MDDNLNFPKKAGEILMGDPVIHQSKPATIEHVDMAPSTAMNSNAMYNDFLVRLEYLRSRNPSWTDPKNQNRPFKPHFLEFIRSLVTRFPVTPEILPTEDGNVIFKFRKKAPKDKWQVMEFTITPQRRFSLKVRSRVATQPPYTKNNLARPDYMSDIIQRFFEEDSVNAKEHPVCYRAATSIDMPYISAIFTTQFKACSEYSPRNIAKTLQYCVVADDPLYGIVSVAAFQKTPKSGDFSNFSYELAGVWTLQPLRGLGIGGKCLRKSLTDLLADHKDAEIVARVPLMAGTQRDNCRGLLSRSGFKRVKVVRGERRYLNFHCDLCDMERCSCVPDSSENMCSTVYYKLNDKGGQQGYGGSKRTGT